MSDRPPTPLDYARPTRDESLDWPEWKRWVFLLACLAALALLICGGLFSWAILQRSN